jgi:mono/diheme cytochrome c family protein
MRNGSYLRGGVTGFVIVLTAAYAISFNGGVMFLKSGVGRWLMRGLAGLVVLLILALVGSYFISEHRINQTYQIQVTAVPIPTSAEALAEGQRLYVVRGCVDCHHENGAGGVFIDDPALGRVSAANLTAGQGGIGGVYQVADWVRSIRHGVGPDGKSLMVMPSQEFNGLNDADLGALVAYVKSLPPVDSQAPANRMGPLGRILLVANVIPLLPAEMIDHNATQQAAIDPGVTVEYGAYLAQTCKGCHGATLSGGPVPGVPADPPYPANLTPDQATGLGNWTEADFRRALREGKRPDGSSLSPEMPWMALGQMTDKELQALWLYLQSVPPQPYGNR